jgi:hypothetical protein
MTELYINVHFDSNGELDAKLSHAHRSEAIIYADEDANYLHTIHYSDGKVEVIDLSDSIREHHAEVALERRHELSFEGVR